MTHEENQHTDEFYKELIGKYVKYEDTYYRVVGVEEISNEQVLKVVELCFITGNIDELSSSGCYTKTIHLQNVDRSKLSVITKDEMLEVIGKKVNISNILLYINNSVTKDKNLAEEYLKRKIKEDPFRSLTIDFNFAFSANDIEEAFNAGRESAIENMPELKWEEIGLYGYRAIYLDVCKARTPLEYFLIRECYMPKEDIILSGNKFSKGGFKTVEEAKSYATKVYKEEIKEILGL